MTDAEHNYASDEFVAASPTNLDYMLELQDQRNVNAYAPKVHGHAIADTEGLQDALDSKSNTGHIHDDRYYTESEMDTKLATKSDTTHLHDDRYYTEQEITTLLSAKSDKTHRHNNATTSADGFMSTADKIKLDGVETGANLVTKVSELTNDSNFQTGAQVTAAINTAVAATLKWQGAVATVDDLPATSTKGYVYHVNANGGEYAWDGSQWVELGSVIEHKWESITGKPSTFTPSAHTHSQSDVTGLASALAGKSDTGHVHDDRYYTESEIDTKLSGKSDTSHTHDSRYYTESEVDSKLSGKANSTHSHTIAQVTNLQTTLDGKAPSSHTHNYAGSSSAGGAATSANKVNAVSLSGVDLNNYRTEGTFYYGGGGNNCSNRPSGVDAFGMMITRVAAGYYAQTLYSISNGAVYTRHYGDSTWTAWAKVYTSANKPTLTELGAAASNHTHGAATTGANGFMSAADKTKLDGIATGANKYTHPSYTARNAGLYKITVDATGHVSGATAVTKADITALGIPSTNTTYGLATTSANGLLRQLNGSTSQYMRGDGTWATPPNTTYGVASQSANGLMSASDKKKLDSISVDSTGSVEIDLTIDTALSTSSTNPVQNKVVTAALNGKAASSHSHGAATTSANGFMSSTDKAKLDGIASGANKTTVDSALSSTSTNPVQNKVINSALAGKAASNHTHNYAAAPSAGGGATYNYLPRVSQSADYTFTGSLARWMEFSSGSANLPSNHYYHVFTGQSTDTNYNTQLALGMTTNQMYYRTRQAGTWGSWAKVYTTVSKPTASEIGAATANHTHSGYAASSHNHSAGNITSGTLPVARGGTGATTAAAARSALGITPANIGAAASSHNHSAANITSGTLAVARGGTGQTTAAGIRNSLGLGNTTGALPIANGGTGATTAAQARANLGITEMELNFPTDNDELCDYVFS